MNPHFTITLAYIPEASERLPWVIFHEGAPVYRVAEDSHATDALKIIPQLLQDGWEPLQAIRRALQDSQAAAFEQFEPA